MPFGHNKTTAAELPPPLSQGIPLRGFFNSLYPDEAKAQAVEKEVRLTPDEIG